LKQPGLESSPDKLSYEVIVATITGPQLETLDGEDAGFGLTAGFATGFVGFTTGFVGFATGFMGIAAGFVGFATGFEAGEFVKTAERHPLQVVDPFFPLLSQQVPPA
jgi:hypothetical protein